MAAAWVLEDEQNDLADRVIDSLATQTATAPHLWALEVGNILLSTEKRGRIDADQRRRMAQALQDLGVAEQRPPLLRRRRSGHAGFSRLRAWGSAP